MIKENECPFCLQLLYKPVMVSPCMHSFCAACACDWFVVSSKCPKCNTPSESISKCPQIQNMVEQIC